MADPIPKQKVTRSKPNPRVSSTFKQARPERSWEAPRAKVEREGRCRVCGSPYDVQAAHIIPRAQVKAGPAEDPSNVVPLCGDGSQGCHGQYDRHERSILEVLTREEQAMAVLLDPGMLAGAYRRLTGQREAA